MNSPAFTPLTRVVVGLCCISAWNAMQADAGPIASIAPPTIQVRMEGEGSEPPRTWQFAPAEGAFQTADGDGNAYKLSAPRQFNNIWGGLIRVDVEELEFDPDPFVLNNLALTNNTPASQVFSVFVGLPTSFTAPNRISGHVGTLLIDGGNDGASLQTLLSQSLYEAQVDFGVVASLHDAPFSMTALPGQQTPTSAFASFGPTASSAEVFDNIGIQLQFRLSPGDTVAILSRFDVTAIPEPCAVHLAGLAAGCAAVARARRRTSRVAKLPPQVAAASNRERFAVPSSAVDGKAT